MNTPTRALLIFALGIVVLGFGAIGLCGGYVTAITLPGLLQGNGEVTAVWVISVPCLLGGFFMVWVCVQKIRRTLNRSPQDEDAS